MKERILQISKEEKLSHLGSNVSMVNILEAIYETKEPNEKFVLSNGHAGLSLYVALERYGGQDAVELLHKHGVHPSKDPEAGIDVSGGSLGQGLPIALGMALARKDRNVYCSISDGECAEGSIWEALRIGAEQNITNCKVVVNANGWGAYREVDRYNLISKFAAFGWTPLEVNGHDTKDIKSALEYERSSPVIVVAHTNSDINDDIKGQASHYLKL